MFSRKESYAPVCGRLCENETSRPLAFVFHCTNSHFILHQECARMSCASGCEQQKIFENQQLLAISNWPKQTPDVATLCRLGLGLGDPSVTPGSPKRHPWVTPGSPLGRIAEVFCLQQELKKRGVGSWLRDAGRGPQKIG